ncbi:hypothetical protein BH10PAT1_BH10PAT1_2150 [soil metagenome]
MGFFSQVNAQAGGIIANPNPVDIGEQIAVTWAVKTPTDNDWIEMRKVGSDKTLAKQKATPTVDGDGRGGVLYFTATKSGDVEFWFFLDRKKYMHSNTISVTGHTSESTRVPFGGGPNVQPTMAPNGAPPWESARQSNVDGGVNLSVVCQILGCSDVVNLDNTANGWRFKNGDTLSMLDWDSICRRVWGSEYHGVKISNNIDGWRCSKGNQNPVQPEPQIAQPQQRDNSCGNLPARLTTGQANVTYGGSDGLNLRADAGTDNSVRGKLRNGDVVSVIGGPKCASGYNWFQVQTANQGTWWIAEGGNGQYWIQNGVGQQPVQPVQVPVQQPVQQKNNGDFGSTSTNPCPDEVGYTSTGFTMVSFRHPLYGISISCVTYIKSKSEYNDLFGCFYKNGWTSDDNTGAADYITAIRQYGKGCPIVTTFQGDYVNLETLSTDGRLLMIWGSYCGETKEAGHIAVFKGYSNSKNVVTVDDANWPAGTSGGLHQHTFSNADKKCVTFVQVWGNPINSSSGNDARAPGQGIASGSVAAAANGVTFGLCIGCVPGMWIGFDLPNGHYDSSTFRLLFKDRYYIGWASGTVAQKGSIDHIVLYLNSQMVQSIITAANSDDGLGNVSNWRLFYTATS